MSAGAPPAVPAAWAGREASFATALRGLRNLFPTALFDGADWDRLVERARRVPAAAAGNLFGFEVRLAEPAPAADFCVTVPPDGPVAADYLRRGGAAAPDSPAEAFAACLREVRGSDSFTDRGIRGDVHGGAILEYDVAAVPPGRHPAPGVFWLLADRAFPGGEGAERLAAFLAATAGRTADRAETAELRRVFAAVAPLGRVSHAGVLPGRAARSFRLLAHVHPPALSTALERLRWPGSMSAALAVVRELHGVAPHLDVAFDVGAGGLGPRLGLELSLGNEWSRTRYADWQPLLDRLAADGRCLPVKVAGLRRWCGFGRILHASGVLIVHRGINHVKIGVGAGAVEAKAYLAAGVARPRRTA